MWRFLGEHDRRSVVVNVPMTYPPEDVPGVVVSGVDTPSIQSEFVHPASLRERFLAQTPDYAIDLRNFGGPSEAENRRTLVQDASKVMTARAAAFRWLLDTQGLGPRHGGLHGNGPDPARAVARPTIRRTRSTTATRFARRSKMRTCSSIGSPRRSSPLARRGSARAGHVRPRRRPADAQVRGGIGAARGGLLHLTAGASYRRGMIERAVGFLRRQPAWIKDLARRLAPGMQRRGYSAMLTQGIDWARTVAYPAEFPAGIRLRRDLTGAERTAALAAVKECLRRLTDPRTGGPLMAHVWDRDELWKGEYGPEAPTCSSSSPISRSTSSSA
jgi:hypothetical protein